MLAGLWLAYWSFGLVSGGIPPLVGPISEELGLSRSAMGSVLGAWPLVYIALAIPAGALIDRFGLRRSLAAGIALVALSGLLRAFAFDFATMFLAIAAFGLGGPFISIGAPKLISVWFDDKERRTAMGVYMTASPIGRIVALATANSVLMRVYASSWRLTLATYGGAAGLAAIAWWLLARDPPQADEGDGKPSFASGLKVFPVLLRIRVVQVILVISVGSFMFNHGLNNWLPAILNSRGLSASEAGIWAALPIVAGLAATMVIPRLATPQRRMTILITSFLAAGGAALVIGTASGAALMPGLLVLGVASRGIMPVIMLTLMDAPQVGASRMGAAGGLYFTAGEVGGVLGPLMVGVVADVTGGFLGGILTLASLCLVLAMLSIGLGLTLRPQTKPGA